MNDGALPLPPPALRFMNEDDERFLATGDGIVSDLLDLCGLRTDSVVLDLGSGYGRVDHALWRRGYRGDYLGLDPLRRHVKCCRRTLTKATGGALRFKHVDVENARYNPKGRLRADSVRFDVADASVDVVVVASVFTHMYPRDVRHYLSELGRLLKPSGRALATFFALDETWREAETAGRSSLPMPFELEPGCRFHRESDPLHAIGYAPTWIRGEVDGAGLRIFACRLGTWCRRAAALGYQDTFVLEHR